LDHLRRAVNSPCDSGSVVGKGTRWLGWRGHVVSEEARRNRMGASK
jgi:hypothetical protein